MTTTHPEARLLIVDDEEALMNALCNTLTQQGYQTTGCTDAAEAMQHLQSASFDLMLTDLMMPLTDGLALAREALARDPRMVIVMMTGQGSIATAVEAMQSGVLDYVLKPFKLGTMLPVLQRALAVGRLRAENADLQQRLQEHTLALENANRELEAYATAVSHDLRTPLRSIDGLALLLEKKLEPVLTKESRYLLDLMQTCTRRAQTLVDDLLRLSQVGREPLKYGAVDVGRIAREVASELQAGSPAKAAIVVTIADDLPVALQADEGLTRQLLANLMGNAMKFSQRSSAARVDVTCQSDGDSVVLCVADNGPGFEMVDAERMFMPFERLSGAQDFEGSGVGLSIVQRIVARHGGRIWVDASPGNGARFYFTLSPDTESTPPRAVP